MSQCRVVSPCIGGCHRLRKSNLDDINWALLRILQRDARITYNSLAQKVGLTIPSVANRMKVLRRSGVIAGFRTEVNARRLGLHITAFIRIAENVRDGKSL